jgi:hypothetical protein
MADQYKSLSDSIRRSGDEISKAISKSTPRERRYVNPDLLTSEEVEELRMLSSAEDVRSFSEERGRILGDTVTGMYRELDDMGFVVCASGVVIGVLPIGVWAVEKHDQRERERMADRRDGRLWSAVISIASVVIGWLLGLLSAGVITNLR